jgi:hypothetical protein
MVLSLVVVVVVVVVVDQLEAKVVVELAVKQDQALTMVRLQQVEQVQVLAAQAAREALLDQQVQMIAVQVGLVVHLEQQS